MVLIYILSVMAYFTMSGFVFGKLQNHYKPLCSYSASNCDAECGHSVGSAIAGLLWPVALPIAAGKVLSNSERVSRDQKRRTKELAEARHKKELARIEAETTYELEKALR